MKFRIILVFVFIFSSIQGQELSIKELPFGYKLSLDSIATKELELVLSKNIDELKLSKFFYKRILKSKAPYQIKIISGIILADIILFKYKLNTNKGKNGVEIEVWGPSYLKGTFENFDDFTKRIEELNDYNYIFHYYQNELISEMENSEKKLIEDFPFIRYLFEAEDFCDEIFSSSWESISSSILDNSDIETLPLKTLPIYWEITPIDK